MRDCSLFHPSRSTRIDLVVWNVCLSLFCFGSVCAGQEGLRVVKPEKEIDVGTHTQSVFFAPDNKTLATTQSVRGGYDVRLWDLSSGKLIHILKDHARNIGSLWF